MPDITTLLSKFLTRLYQGVMPSVLAQSGAAVSVSATTSEEVLATIAIPAGVMGTTGRVVVDTTWAMTGSVNAKTLKFRAGAAGSGLSGTAFVDTAQSGSTMVSQRLLGGLQAITATSQTNLLGTGTASGVGASAVAAASLAVDTTAAWEIAITGQKASAGETLTLVGYSVSVLMKTSAL